MHALIRNPGCVDGKEGEPSMVSLDFAADIQWKLGHSQRVEQQESQTQTLPLASTTKSNKFPETSALRLARLGKGLNTPPNVKLIDEIPANVRRLDATVEEIGPPWRIAEGGQGHMDRRSVSHWHRHLAQRHHSMWALSFQFTFGDLETESEKISNGLAPQAGESQ